MSDLPLADHDLSTLVDEWLTWKEAAAALCVTEAKVRTMVRDHELADAVPTPGAGPRVPALFIQDGLPVKGLPGLLTVLHEYAYSAIAWARRLTSEPRFSRSASMGRPGRFRSRWSQAMISRSS